MFIISKHFPCHHRTLSLLRLQTDLLNNGHYSIINKVKVTFIVGNYILFHITMLQRRSKKMQIFTQSEPATSEYNFLVTFLIKVNSTQILRNKTCFWISGYALTQTDINKKKQRFGSISFWRGSGSGSWDPH